MSPQIGTPMRTPLKLTGSGIGPGTKNAFFIEDAIVRQINPSNNLLALSARL